MTMHILPYALNQQLLGTDKFSEERLCAVVGCVIGLCVCEVVCACVCVCVLGGAMRGHCL